MVYTEIWKILDCGTKKSVPEIYMTKHGLKLYNNYKWEESHMEQVGYKYEHNKDLYDKWRKDTEEYYSSYDRSDPDEIYPTIRNELIYRKGLPQKPKMLNITDEEYEKFKTWDWIGGQPYNPKMDQMLFRYYDIKPFEPWVMINISPDWAGKKITKGNICKLKRTFQEYMKEEWYSEWVYVLEAGGAGDHLHLHALCKMNKNKQIKSVRSHVSKHWKRQIQKHAKTQGGGFGGLIKLPGMQAIVIQGENGDEILQDKMDYLVEEKKPIGHKNKTPKTLEGLLGVLNRGNL